MPKKESHLSNLDSWVRQDVSLIPVKLQVQLEEPHFTITHGKEIGIIIRSIPKYGEIAVLHRSNLPIGSLEQIEGKSGLRMLTLVPEYQRKQPVTVQLITYNNGKRRPTIMRSELETYLSYERFDRDHDEVNSILETLSQDFYHIPLFATTTLDLRRAIAGGQIWAEVDGKYVDLASIDPTTIELTSQQRKVLSQQLKELQMTLCMLGDPNQHANIPSATLQQFDLEKIPGDYEKFLRQSSVVSETIQRWSLTQ